jgi:hypothetical protein
MGRIVDNLIAFRILSMLVTNFEDTDAFKHGIIDAKGKPLKKYADLTTSEEKDAYTYLHRLVFTMKKIINKVGGESKLKSIVAAYWLVKEYYEGNSRTTSLMEERYVKVLEMLERNVVLVEEELIVKKFFAEEGEGGAPTNNTAGVAGLEKDGPVVRKKDIKKFRTMARRTMPDTAEIKP